jgi:hypothetical protein
MARRAADGKLEQGCCTNSQAMQSFLDGTAPGVPPAPPIAEVQ